MKRIILGTMLLMAVLAGYSQDLAKFKLYDPTENAEQKINEAVKQAKEEGKHVFIQIGGNWCIWCARFHDFVTTDKSIDSLIRANYVVYHMNYSEENHNTKLLARYGYPQRFGYPVFLILDKNGKLLHTQNTSYLEDGKEGYNRNAIVGFLNDWSPAAFDPKHYKD